MQLFESAKFLLVKYGFLFLELSTYLHFHWPSNIKHSDIQNNEFLEDNVDDI